MKKLFIICALLIITFALKAQSETEIKNSLRAGFQGATFEGKNLGGGIFTEYTRKLNSSFSLVASLGAGMSNETALLEDIEGIEYQRFDTYQFMNSAISARYTPFAPKNKWVSVDAGFYYQYLQNISGSGYEDITTPGYYINNSGTYAKGNQVGLLLALVGIGTFHTDITMNTLGIFYCRKF